MLKIIFGIIILLYALYYILSFGEMTVTSSVQAVSALLDGVIYVFVSIWLIRKGLKQRRDKKEGVKNKKMKFVEFISKWVKNPVDFNKKYAKDEYPPYLLFTAWILGIAHLLNVYRISLVGNPLMAEVNDWWVIWPTVLIMGFFWGLFLYYLVGFVLHLLIKLSGGKTNYKMSCNILLYSNVYLFGALILDNVLKTIIFGNGYFYGEISSLITFLLFLFVFVAVIYSLVKMYSSVVTVTKASTLKSIIFIFTIPLIAILVFGWTKVNAPYLSAENIKNIEAIRTFQNGDIEEAEDLFNAMIEQLTEKGDMENVMKIYINEGILFELSGQLEKAKSVYSEALSKSSVESSHYFVINGLIAVIEGDIEKALNYFKKALELDINDFNANNRIGMIYSGRMDLEYKDLEKALSYNQRAYNLNPDDAAATQNLAINYYELGEFDEALPMFLVLIKSLPDNVLSKYLLGMTYYKLEDLDNAKIYLNEAIEIDPALNTEDVQLILSE